jgi:hypothetical protein
VAFLESGVGWACSLYADLIGHWRKRNPKALAELDPEALDANYMIELLGKYGDARVTGMASEITAALRRPEIRPPVDDWAALRIKQSSEFRGLFEPNFYFGCEADDPLNAWAFNTKVNPYQAQLHPVLGSDIAHWDVVDMTDVLEEAFELVDHGVISETDFRAFTFENPQRAFGINPDFFVGTTCGVPAKK